jgi:hypothetical protein
VHMLVQRYEVLVTVASQGNSLTVYPLEDPCTLDALRLSSWSCLRNRLSKWRVIASDTPGTRRLVDPQQAQPQWSLLDPKCPCLVVLEELRSRGWAPSKSKLTHEPGSDKMYNSTLPLSKKFYYQCLLGLPGIFEKGLASLPSDQPQGFYKLILAGQAPQAGLRATAYKQLLGGGEVEFGMQDEGPALQDLQDQSSDDAIVAPRAPLRDPLPPPLPLQEGPLQGPLPLPEVPAGPVQRRERARSRSSSSSSFSSQRVVAPSAPSREYPRVLNGGSLKREDYVPRRGRYGTAYCRYILTCQYHANCQKKRNTGPAQTKLLGQSEPLAYLSAWHRRGPDIASAAQHIAFNPTVHDVQEAFHLEGFA